ncbi:MAG: GNAT family N-acetyltransferase [Betaproteobacteria bacterium]
MTSTAMTPFSLLMPPSRNPAADKSSAKPRLTVHVARHAGEVAEAQRLRHKVFVEEMGARLMSSDGREHDEFDPWCDHLIVRDADSLRVVGTYRMLTPHRARELGRLYSETEFDLARFDGLRASLIEVGRSCVHRDYRSGSTILLLWAGLARYMKQGGYRHLIGCASVSLADGGAQAARIRDELHGSLTPPEYRVFPRLPFPHDKVARAVQFELPPLLEGYLRLGGRICGEPAWDPDFNSADFLVWVALDSMNARYARHFDLLAQTAEQAQA